MLLSKTAYKNLFETHCTNKHDLTQQRWSCSSGPFVITHIVCLQEFAGEDSADLFLEEREASLRQAQEEKHKLQMSVPGILNPHELPEEMCEWAPVQFHTREWRERVYVCVCGGGKVADK